MATKRNLTQKDVNNAKYPEAGEYWLQDGAVKHLGVRVRSNRTKLYIMRYYLDGKQRKHTIGSAVTMPLSEARELATEFNGKLVAASKQPRWIERRKATLQDLFDENVKELEDTGAADTYVTNWRSMWHHHVPAKLKTKQARDVSHKDVDTLLIGIAKKHPTTANRVRGVLSRIYKRALKYGTVEFDPTVKAYRAKEHPKTRWLSEGEAEALHKAMVDDLHMRSVRPKYPRNMISGVEQFHAEQRSNSAAAALMMLYTGARPVEVFKAKWGEFDLEQGRWVKPKENVKQGTEHAVPLLSEAVDLLKLLWERRAPGVGPDHHVFTKAGEPGNRLRSIKRYFAGARKRAGIDDVTVTPYVMRKTFASRLVQNGVPIPTAMILTGHKSVQTLLRHYAHSGEEQAREALRAVRIAKRD